jgi:hypothetical protein
MMAKTGWLKLQVEAGERAVQALPDWQRSLIKEDQRLHQVKTPATNKGNATAGQRLQS